MHLCALRDLDSADGAVDLHSNDGAGKVNLHPVPNPNDPNDPLQWPLWKRHAALASICTFTFASNFAYAGISPALLRLVQDFGRSPTEVARITSWAVLALGLCNFLWVPVGQFLGKRPVFVVASAAFSICMIWAAVAQSFGSLLWAIVVSGIVGSSAEALGASVVADLYFVHQRGFKMGIYLSSLLAGTTLGPVFGGLIVTHNSWRIFYWLAFALGGLSLVSIALFYPDTRYDRIVAKTVLVVHDAAIDEKADAEDKRRIRPADIEARSPSDSLRSSPVLTARRTWREELSIRPVFARDSRLLVLFVRPLFTVCYPAVVFAWLTFSIPMAWVISMTVMSTFVLQSSPYSWTPGSTGLVNIAGVIGCIAGAIGGGWLCERYVKWRSRNNNGVFVPETRLHLILLPGLIVAAGGVLFGYGAEKHLHWISLFFGLGMASMGYAASSAAMTYVSDCYLPVNADALVLITGLKNVAAFGFTYSIVPWVTSNGYIKTFGTQAGIFLLVAALSLPLIVFGSKIRRASLGWRIVPR